MIDDEGAGPVRAELDHLAASTPPVGFTAADVIGRGRRRRQVRRGAAVGGTAAALALVVAVPTLVLRDTGPDRTTVAATSGTPTPEVSPSRPPAPTPTPTFAGPAVPGLSPAAADRIARGCALSYGGGKDAPSGDPAATPSPVPTSPGPEVTPGAPEVTVPPPAVTPTGPEVTPTGPEVSPPVPSATPRGWDGAGRLQDDVHVYNYVKDAAGRHALVYGPWDYLSCTVGESATHPYLAEGASFLPMHWLPGPVAVDAQLVVDGGVQHSGANVPANRGYILVEGRVSREVARLTVSVGADRSDVRPVNGTFLVRWVKSADYRSGEVPQLHVTAYDRGGRSLPLSINSHGGCWVDPAGKVVIGDRANSPEPCEPATPWN